jgi:hypothetical protein
MRLSGMSNAAQAHLAWCPAFALGPGAQAQESNGVFAVIAAIGAEFIQDGILVFPARLA